MPKRPGLPFRITLCAVLVLITAAWNFLRLLTGITWFQVLQSYAPEPGPLYLGGTGALWTAVGLVLVWGLARRRSWAPRAMLVGAWLYAAWAWTDRILLQGGGSPNWPFALIATALVLGFITAAMLDRRIDKFFGKEAHELEPQDPSSP